MHVETIRELHTLIVMNSLGSGVINYAILSLVGPGFSSTSPAMMSKMVSIGTTEHPVCEGGSTPAFRRLSIDLHFSDPTRRSVDTRRIGKKQALVSRYGELLRLLLLLPTATSRVNSATKGRKRWSALVCCTVFPLFLCLVLNARLQSWFLPVFLPLDGLPRRQRASGLPVVNACQSPILALHWFTSIPIVLSNTRFTNSLKLVSHLRRRLH